MLVHRPLHDDAIGSCSAFLIPSISRRDPGSAEREDDMDASAMSDRNSGYELRFRSLFKPGRGLSFDCDSSGNVDLDVLSERARENYLYARTVIGREFFIPVVQRRDLH